MSRRSRFFIDIALLVGLLVANAPARTGLAVHEWLSIALIVPLLVHLVINWEWTLHVTKRFFERLFSVSRLNLVVDVALLVSTVAVMVSGLAVSSVLTGMLGIANAATPLWVAVHASSASATIVLLLVHFALHGAWFVQTITLMFEGRASAGRSPVLEPAHVAEHGVGPRRHGGAGRCDVRDRGRYRRASRLGWSRRRPPRRPWPARQPERSPVRAPGAPRRAATPRPGSRRTATRRSRNDNPTDRLSRAQPVRFRPRRRGPASGGV